MAFGLRMEGLRRAEVAKRIGEYLDLVGLGGFDRRLPSEMSGGQQQRVALARALAKRPAVLLLDEPLGALDLKLRRQMQTELSRIHRQVGTTFVFVTHDQEEALSMATRIAIMSGGNVKQTGTPREVYDHPVGRFVASFVGETNFLTGTVTTEDGRRVVAIPGRGRVAAPTGSTDGPATHHGAAGVRPVATWSTKPPPTRGSPGASSTSPSWATTLGSRSQRTRATSWRSGPHGTTVRSTHLEEDLGEEVCVWWPADDAALITD